MSAPRLIAPGRLDVVVLDDGIGWIERGPLADVPPAVPHQEDLGRVALIPVEAASQAPGDALDLDGHPFVRAQLARVRWVLVPAARVQARPRLELRGGSPELVWVPESGPKRRVKAPDPVLWARLLGEDPHEETVHRWAETGVLQDRLARALSDGAVSLRDVELARWARSLRPDTLDHEEAILEEIGARALSDTDAVGELLAVLEQADAGSDDVVSLPVYGEATRVVEAAFTLEDGDGVTVEGAPFEVPEEVLWQVSEVEPWEPSASGERRAASFADWHEKIQETRRSRRRNELFVWGGLGLLLLVVVAIVLLWPFMMG